MFGLPPGPSALLMTAPGVLAGTLVLWRTRGQALSWNSRMTLVSAGTYLGLVAIAVLAEWSFSATIPGEIQAGFFVCAAISLIGAAAFLFAGLVRKESATA